MTHPLLDLLGTVSASWAMGGGGRPEAGAGDSARPLEDASALDLAGLVLSLFEEGQRVNDALFRLMVSPLLELPHRGHGASRAPGGAAQHEDALVALLVRAQRWVVQYPVLAQTVYSTLIAEGRRYSRTAEGARWAQALNRSPTVRRSRPLFEAMTSNMSEDAGNAVLPSTLLQAVRELGATRDLEAWLAQVRHGFRKENA